MFLRRWAESPARAWLSPARLVPPGEDRRVVELQGQVLDYLSHLRSAAASGATDLAAALATGGLPRLLVQPSTIRGAGRGLFLAPGSSVPAGAVLTFYPGLVYDQEQLFREMAVASPGDDDAFAPAPPAFSLGNHYLLHLRACLGRCLMVDGRPDGLSAARFEAAARGDGAPVNAAWLEGERGADQPGARLDLPMGSSNGAAAQASGVSSAGEGSGGSSSSSRGEPEALLLQAAAGHLINHQPLGEANATFDLCPLPASLPAALLRFVPALNAAGGDPGLRWVPLVRALRPLAAPEPRTSGASGNSSPGLELFVDYGANPSNLGFHF